MWRGQDCALSECLTFAPIMTSAVQQQNLRDERMATGSRDGELQTGQDLGSSDAPTARSPAALIEYEMYSDVMSTPEMRSVFSETSTLRTWLKTWAAMAEAQAEHGLIPKEAAVRIVEVSGSLTLSGAELAEETRSVGRATVPVLQRLRAAVGKDFANHVHVGSTTQDIMDTGLALQIKQGLDLLDRDTTAPSEFDPLLTLGARFTSACGHQAASKR